MNEPMQIAVSGAAGRIAYALLFRIAAGGMFGAGQPVSLSLLDIPDAHHLLEANAIELDDCGFPLLTGIQITEDPRQAFKGADWVILLAGQPLTSVGQRRADLLRANGPIFVEHGRAINDVAATARILVVANPCNTNCRIAMSHAHEVPTENWFTLNRIDRMRATALIANKACVPLASVTRVTVWGNHGESIFPDFHNAFINEKPAHEVIRDEVWVREVFEPTVSHRSRKVINLRDASPAATAAQAILGTIWSISTPTPFNRRFGAGVVSDGSYGIPRGLVFGFPLHTEDGRSWSIVQDLYLDDHAQQRLAVNVAELEQESAAVLDLMGTAWST